MEKRTRFIQTNWFWGFAGLIALVIITAVFNALVSDITTARGPYTPPEISYSWEKSIPFLPISIIPYMSLYVFTALSFFIPMTSYAQRQHSLRLILGVPLAYLFFFLYPMGYTLAKPAVHGFWHELFDRVMAFDPSFGQSPSLHIIHLVIVWRIYLTWLRDSQKTIWSCWCLLIAVSVLTAYQHHVVDVVTGFGVGVVICYVFPLSSLHTFSWSYKQHLSQALNFLLPAAVLFAAAFFVPFWPALVLVWCSISVLFVGLGYLGLGPVVFQKHRYGRFSYAARMVHLPYRAGSRLVRHFFFKGVPEPQKITDQLYFGAYGMQDKVDCKVVFDLCSEYERVYYRDRKYVSFPIIDRTTPTMDELHDGVMKLDRLLKENKTVFVHCAMGRSRSAALAAAWLIFSRQMKNMEDVFTFFKDNNIQSHLSAKHVRLLAHYSQHLQG